MAGLPDYAELHCLSNFSFLRGASHAEELVGRAAALGYAALALTDECSLAGIVRAHLAAREHQLKLIVGAELRLEDGTQLALLATDRRSYGVLSSLIATGRRRGKKGSYALARAAIEVSAASGLLALLLAETGTGLPRISRGGPGLRPSCTAGRTTVPGSTRCAGSRAPAACRWSRRATCTCTCARAGGCRTR